MSLLALSEPTVVTKQGFTFEVTEHSVNPGEFSLEAGFDATPLNVCKSRNKLIGVSEVIFSDNTSWKSPLTTATCVFGKHA
jgi:hypothetical protein